MRERPLTCLFPNSYCCVAAAYSFRWMSISRTPPTPSPTPSALSTNISSSSESTTSRLDKYENPSVHAFRERERYSASPTTVLRSSRPDTNNSLSQFHHPADNTPDRPMAKRFHMESPDIRGRPDPRSSPSTDSQGGMADNETEAGRCDQSEMTPPPTAPLKKKRTRTLTTPHQSAVLHALLAQVFSRHSSQRVSLIQWHVTVSLSNNSNARRGGPLNWFECPQGSGG